MKIYAISVVTSHPEVSWLYGPEESMREQFNNLKEILDGQITGTKRFIELHGWGKDVERLDRTLYIEIDEITEVGLFEF